MYSVEGPQRAAVVTAAARGASLRPPTYGVGVVDHSPVQGFGMAAPGRSEGAGLHRAAELGVSGAGGSLPHLKELSRAFGKHDLSGVKAHCDGPAARGAASLGTIAYARGEHVAFAGPPSLRVAAHEAAHVVQQRSGLQLPQGFGRADDVHERMADAVAERVVAGRSAEDLLDRVASPARAQADASAPVQCYQQLPANKLYAQMPAKRPWFGYPYAVVNAGDFVAQLPRANVGGADQFLDAPNSNTAWTAGAGGGLALRLSDDQKMAIEDSDLVARQPKVFYATTDVVQASNTELQRTGSSFSLQADNGRTVTVLSGWWSQKTLLRVTPQYNNGSADNAPQNCNAIAGKVIGTGAEQLNSASTRAFDAAKRLAPTANSELKRVWDDNDIDVAPYEEDVVKEYAQTGVLNTRALARERVNRFAAPGLGQAYMIANLGRGQDLGNGLAQIRDYATNTDRDVSWPYHFAGVVAVSGSDRITLENYARGDMRQNTADPRWYFQMYGQAKGQSFHEQQTASGAYANALTIAVSK